MFYALTMLLNQIIHGLDQNQKFLLDQLFLENEGITTYFISLIFLVLIVFLLTKLFNSTLNNIIRNEIPPQN